MPDAMSPDPEVEALAEAVNEVLGFHMLGRDDGAKYAPHLLAALHAAGYRVVAAEPDYAPADENPPYFIDQDEGAK